MDSTEYIGENIEEKERQSRLTDMLPAVVIAAFGSSRRGKAALELFHEKVVERYTHHTIFWGYTSSIIRQKTGKPSLYQTLTEVKAAGFRQAVVLPLQIFPGSEYREIAATAVNFPGLEVVVGETLMHRWKFVKAVLDVVEKDFLGPDEGLNILVLHGTPLTGDPVNGAYLGLARLVADNYAHVVAASLEGVPDCEAVFRKIARMNPVKKYRRVRIFPLLFIAGLHVEEDVMGKGASWKTRLEKMGFEVECPIIEHTGERLYKSLASYPEVHEFFLRRLDRGMKAMPTANYRAS
jgi:sirohydrochlorin cobaltochelatase